ncbi:MAG: phosphoserine phosphatase RsbU/P, partial [Acidobacteriaceae bacterium]|nr:phosphoserine phosphatase RsbU/P [Acidobacteriaceae bacterium]
MPNLFVRAEETILKPLGRPALSGVAEHGAFWTSLLLVLLVALRFLPGPSGALNFLLLLVVVPLWVVFCLILFYRWMVRSVLWKVRNRLVVTYLLMGLAPVVLFVTLAVIAAYVFAGQFATFAATSELDAVLGRLSAKNQALTIHVAHTLGFEPQRSSIDLPDYDIANRDIPGTLIVDAWADDRHLLLTADGRALPQHTAKDPMSLPSWAHDGFRGVIIDNGRLFLRSINQRTAGPHRVTFVSSMALNAATVEQLAQGLGTIYLIPDVGKVLKEVDAQDKSIGPHVTTGRELAERTEQSVGGGMLAPPAFLLDRKITFSAPLATTDWREGKQLTSLLNVSSRPALLYAHLFGTAVVVGTVIRYGLITLAVVFALLELVAFVMAVRLNRTITRAVGDLYRATVAIDHGQFAHRIQVQRRDQLGALSTSFNRMSESLERLMEQQREKERMQSELAIAQEVQNNLFPHGHLELPGLELHGVCKPARSVSGDYYDFLLMGKSELCLAMGDISGKGISAALLMASLHSAVRAYAFADEDNEHGENGHHPLTTSPVTFS